MSCECGGNCLASNMVQRANVKGNRKGGGGGGCSGAMNHGETCPNADSHQSGCITSHLQHLIQKNAQNKQNQLLLHNMCKRGTC